MWELVKVRNQSDKRLSQQSRSRGVRKEGRGEIEAEAYE
jgi:hypothetical protein